MNPVFKGYIESGKIKLEAPERYAVHVSKLEGNRIELILRKQKSQRSIAQNSYYWGVIIEILRNQFGYEAEEMHEALKFKFLRKGKEGLETVISTAKLTTAEFENYMERVRRWAAQEHSCYIPQPNEIDMVA